MCQCIYLCVTDSQGRKHLGVPFPSCCGKSAVKELLVSAQWLDECHYQCLRDSVIFLILAAIGSPDASCNFSHQVLSQGRKEREGKPWLYLFLFIGKSKSSPSPGRYLFYLTGQNFVTWVTSTCKDVWEI